MDNTQSRYRVELRVDHESDWKDTGMAVHGDGRVSFIQNVPIESAYFGALHVSESSKVDELTLLRREVDELKRQVWTLAMSAKSAAHLARGIKDLERRGMA